MSEAELTRLRSQLAAETEGLLKVTDERDRLRETERKLIGDVNYLGKRIAEVSDQRDTLQEEIQGERLSTAEAEAQRDTLLAAGKRYLYALSVANGTTGPDDRQDALEGLETAISEVEGER